MSVSGFSESDSSSQTFLWVAAVRKAFLGRSSFTALLSSAVPGSSSLVLFVPTADALLVGILGGGGSLVPLFVVWAKQARVLCPSLPHLRQSFSSFLCWSISSCGTLSMVALNESHRISCSGNLSFVWGPSPPKLHHENQNLPSVASRRPLEL